MMQDGEAIAPTQDASRMTKKTVQIRLTAEQHEKLKKLGGSKWIAEQIEKSENSKFGISIDHLRDVP